MHSFRKLTAVGWREMINAEGSKNVVNVFHAFLEFCEFGLHRLVLHFEFYSLLARSFDVLVEVDDLVIIFFVHEWGCDHEIGGRAVVGDRDIVGPGRCGGELLTSGSCGWAVRGSEKNTTKSMSFDDFCADLLVSSERGPLL